MLMVNLRALDAIINKLYKTKAEGIQLKYSTIKLTSNQQDKTHQRFTITKTSFRINPLKSKKKIRQAPRTVVMGAADNLMFCRSSANLEPERLAESTS